VNRPHKARVPRGVVGRFEGFDAVVFERADRKLVVLGGSFAKRFVDGDKRTRRNCAGIRAGEHWLVEHELSCVHNWKARECRKSL